MARKSPPLLNAIYAISSAHLEHRGLHVEERALDLHSKALQGLAGLIAHKDEGNRDEVLAVIILLLYYEACLQILKISPGMLILFRSCEVVLLPC